MRSFLRWNHEKLQRRQRVPRHFQITWLASNFWNCSKYFLYDYNSARIYRPSFREKTKTLVFHYWQRAFWACFHENKGYKFGHRRIRVETTMLFREHAGVGTKFWINWLFRNLLCYVFLKLTRKYQKFTFSWQVSENNEHFRENL